MCEHIVPFDGLALGRNENTYSATQDGLKKKKFQAQTLHFFFFFPPPSQLRREYKIKSVCESHLFKLLTKSLTSHMHTLEVRPWSFVWPWPVFIWPHVPVCVSHSLTLNCLPIVVGMVRQWWESTVLLYLCFWFLPEVCGARCISFFFRGGWRGVHAHVYNTWLLALLSLGLWLTFCTVDNSWRVAHFPLFTLHLNLLIVPWWRLFSN